MNRRVLYISGTRADYGLMRRTLRAIQDHPALDLEILACGMHLDPYAGETISEIFSDGFAVVDQVATHDNLRTGAGMARGIGQMIVAFTSILEDRRPDIVLLLGDRGEMLAGAIAALHLNIPITHIHGGERSGTVDEPVRHAISKLSHLHLTATAASRDRLIAMGERADDIHAVGAPGLDGLTDNVIATRDELAASLRLDPAWPIALMVYHPVLQEADSAGDTVNAILAALDERGIQVVALKPNTDGGSGAIADQLDRHGTNPRFRHFTHLPRDMFVSWMAAADFMIGNSSAGIIEAASFATPVVNVGPRQNLRERSANVIDAGNSKVEIGQAIDTALMASPSVIVNVYGDGFTAARVADILHRVDFTPLLRKCNAY